MGDHRCFRRTIHRFGDLLSPREALSFTRLPGNPGAPCPRHDGVRLHAAIDYGRLAGIMVAIPIQEQLAR
jgi:hypothetical protein